jgi:uncharacterized DUF497 family protein
MKGFGSIRAAAVWRIVAIRVADGLHLTVVYTDRRQEGGDHVRRIISARRSNRRERKAYRKAISG